MVRKSYSYQDRLWAVKEVLNRDKSYAAVGRMLGTDHKQIRRWVAHYKRYGKKGIEGKKQTYSLAFKLSVLSLMYKNKLSLFQTALEFGILNESVIGFWKHSYEKGTLKEKPKRRMKKKVSCGKSKVCDLSKVSRKDLEQEVEYLRAEVAYLKKLRTLTQQRLSPEKGKEPGSSRS
ncbi:MAG: transposase [Tannerellaceae bacterium]|nr:transposase [Tannerellaceae bacterium]